MASKSLLFIEAIFCGWGFYACYFVTFVYVSLLVQLTAGPSP
jgi:hypothetical protein